MKKSKENKNNFHLTNMDSLSKKIPFKKKFFILKIFVNLKYKKPEKGVI